MKSKQIFAICIILIIFTLGCIENSAGDEIKMNKNVETESEFQSETSEDIHAMELKTLNTIHFSDMLQVRHDGPTMIYCHNQTGVCYFYKSNYHGGVIVSPVFNADGSFYTIDTPYLAEQRRLAEQESEVSD